MNKKKARKKLALILIGLIVIKAFIYFAMSFFIRATLLKFVEKKLNKMASQNPQLEDLKKEIRQTHVKAQFALPEKGDEIVVLKIKNYGTLKFKLFKNLFPETIELFKNNIKNSKYDGISFPKISEDFGIQAGKSKKGELELEDTELNPFVHPFNGALYFREIDALRKGEQLEFYVVSSNKGKTADFKALEKEKKEFFKGKLEVEDEEVFKFDEETIKEFKKNGGCPDLDFKVSVIGQLFSGKEVLEKIAKSPVDKEGKPKKQIILEKAEIKKY